MTTPSWTPKAARARSMRKLRALTSRVEDTCNAVAYEFGDEDQYVVDMCDELKRQFEAAKDDLVEALDHAVNPDPN